MNLAAADLIPSTSAGSIIGTVLATGQDPAGLAVPPPAAPATAPAPQPDPGLITLFARDVLTYETSIADPQTVVTISPDTQAIDAFGPNLYDRAAWQPAYQG
ncbi:hypothetical protein [Nonomuraea sp. NPDC005650]|uniref:hypothetical protein n=1 Tax=Nonomuraea sp. NPDC005650 TaxID=3157045 RepID=UPI0033B3330C